MHDLYFILVDEFVEKNDTLVVPDLDSAILTACRDKAQVMAIRTTDDVLLVTLRLATLD